MNFSEVHISFSTKKNMLKQITQGKPKHHDTLNELSISESADFVFEKKTFHKTSNTSKYGHFLGHLIFFSKRTALPLVQVLIYKTHISHYFLSVESLISDLT